MDDRPISFAAPWDSVFTVPLGDQILLYAPLHHLAALLNRTALSQLARSLVTGQAACDHHVSEIASALQTRTAAPPLPRQGALDPAFLGLLPTRACDFACRYCGFFAPGSGQDMDLRLARDAVDWYMDLARQAGRREVEIHYFGGEPFCAPAVLDLTVHLARIRGQEFGCTVHFEIATNGGFDEQRCRWAADHLDTIVLSFDGPADIQDAHRPRRDGRDSFDLVARSARILSDSSANLFFRSCVTSRTVGRMAEIAAWFCEAYRPAGVCFEPLQPMAGPAMGQFEPPDPWEFAYHFDRAAGILEAHGVEPIYAAADISTCRVSFCPVGRDAVILSPDGSLSACYLPAQEWEARGLDLSLGRMSGGSPELDVERLDNVRSLNAWNKPFCARCFSKWHCAGGCHVHHVLPPLPGDYDRLCIQTRIITLRNILRTLGRLDLYHELLQAPRALESAVLQPSDVLCDGVDGL